MSTVAHPPFHKIAFDPTSLARLLLRGTNSTDMCQRSPLGAYKFMIIFLWFMSSLFRTSSALALVRSGTQRGIPPRTSPYDHILSPLRGRGRIISRFPNARYPQASRQYRSSTWGALFGATDPEQPTGALSSLPHLKDLNDSQHNAVTLPEQCIARVVAGPGSGKTRVLTCRMAHLLSVSDRNRILGVTFTRKAAGEMKDRLANLVGASSLDRVTLGTFHSVCATILRWNGNHLASLNQVERMLSQKPLEATNVPLEGTFSIVDSTEQVRILNLCLEESSIDLKQYNLKPFGLLNIMGTCRDALAQGENPFRTKEGKGKPSKVLEIVRLVLPKYQHALWSNNQVDFDDLILLTRQLLLEVPEVRQRLHARWPHVLVDEFQDTSQSQMDLVQLLTTKSLFVVGDADQCIYTWRGAHASSLQDFCDKIQGHTGVDHVETIYLMENYRSTTNIVRAAQKVINTAYGGADNSNDMRQDMKPKRGKGSSPRIIACKDDEAEALHVINLVKEMMLSSKCTSDSSLALIYRTNAQSRVLEEALVKQNVPYVIFGSATSFYKRQEIRDCLCFLRWLYDGRDKASMARAFKTPARGIGPATVDEFDAYCSLVAEAYQRNHPEDPVPSPLDVLIGLTKTDGVVAPEMPPPEDTISKRGLNAMTKFAPAMLRLRKRAEIKPIKDVMSEMIKTLQLESHFDKISKTKAEFEDRMANVQELLQASERYHEHAALEVTSNEDEEDGFQAAQTPLGAFLDDVALITDMADEAERSQEDRFVVSMMTVHASKGMEFDTVFVVGMEDGTLPSFQAVEEGEDSVPFQEEQRLCYVAMTRAKTDLYLTWRKSVPVFTKTGLRYVARTRSRFLDVLVKKKDTEIDDEPRQSSLGPQSSNPKRVSTNSGTRRAYSSTATPTGRHPVAPRGVRAATPKGTNGRRRSPARGISSTGSAIRRIASGQSRPPPSASAKARPQPANGRHAASTTSPTPTTGSTQSTSPRRVSSRPQRSMSGVTQSRQSSAAPQSPKKAVEVDSTWFYPVGSDVQHSNFGRGTVLPPKSKETVCVRFETGKEVELPVEDAQLVPALN